MSHLIAGIDVHKKMLAVVIADVGGEGVGPFQHRRSGATPEELRVLGVWLAELGVQEVVMESTAQYWKPVWQELKDGSTWSWRRRSPTAERGGVNQTFWMRS